jgi:hypothetical protein
MPDICMYTYKFMCRHTLAHSSFMHVVTWHSYTSTPHSYTDIYPVQPLQSVHAGDILFLSSPQSAMVQFNAQAAGAPIKGLRILDVSALDLPGRGTEFFELGQLLSSSLMYKNITALHLSS